MEKTLALRTPSGEAIKAYLRLGWENVNESDLVIGFRASRKENGEFNPTQVICTERTPELAQRETAVIRGIEAIEAHYLINYIEKRDKANEQKQS